MTTTPAAPAATTRPTTTDFTALPLRRRATWVIMLGALTALGAFTVDLYLPAFPTLAREFDVSASAVQLTLTGSLLGVGLGQLLVGPLSDALGRRRPLLVGLSLHLLASLACAFAPSIAVLGLLRVLQGVGVASASVVALAVVRDRFAGRGAARLLARLMIVIGASPIFAPTLGSALLGAVHWRGIFVVLGLLSLSLGLVVAAVLPETLPRSRRRPATAAGVAAAYRGVLRDRAVLGLLVIAGTVMAALFGYVANSSFIFQEQYGLSRTAFAVLFAAGGLCLIAGSQVNGTLVSRVSSRGLLTTGLSGATASVALLVLTTTTGALGLVGLLVPLWAAMFCIGLSMPNPPVMALERHPHAAGTTAAVVGATQNTVAALASPLAGLLGLSPVVGMAVTMGAALAIALTSLLLVVLPTLRREAVLAAQAHELDAPASEPAGALR